MLTPEQVSELADTMVVNGIGSLEVKGADYAIRLVRASDTPVKRSPTKAVSPATGSFQPRGLDDGLPEIQLGSQVLAKEPLGYVGIGPIRVLCLSPAIGRVIGTLPMPQKSVTAGEPLFTVEPSP